MYLSTFISKITNTNIDIIDTGYVVNVDEFMFTITSLGNVFKMTKFTLIDIIHTIKYALVFCKKRNELFGYMPTKSPFKKQDKNNAIIVDSSAERESMYGLYSNVFKNVVFIKSTARKINRVIDENPSDDFEKCVCLPVEMMHICEACENELLQASLGNVEGARDYVMKVLSTF
jgi:hypothetical protein